MATLAAVAFGFALATPLANGAEPCAAIRHTPPTLRIETDFRASAQRPPAEPVDNSILQRIAARSAMPGLLGLTVAKPHVEADYALAVVQRNGVRCAALSRVRVATRLEQRVYADRRHGSLSCVGRIIAEHEQLHVNYNNRGYRVLTASLRADLRRLELTQAGRWRPLEAFEREIRRTLGNTTQRALAEYRRTAEPLHAAIDTPEAYRRQFARCRRAGG